MQIEDMVIIVVKTEAGGYASNAGFKTKRKPCIIFLY
jgi:hypothetical protein